MRKGLLTLLLCAVSCLLIAQNETVIFSSPGGMYSHSFQLRLSCLSQEHHVRFTTNGNTPDATSLRYEEPLALGPGLYSHADIFTISTSPDHLFYAPDSVSHAIVIRAAVFDANDSCISKTVTHTYLIQELGFEHHNLAVVSLCLDSLSLFDYATGIMIPGATWDPDDPERTGNYFQTGREWERLAHVEFIEPDQRSSINQECGVRTHGNRARLYPSKGLKLYAREEYGKKRFDHDIFNSDTYTSFKRLVLKPYSTLWPLTGVQDHICNIMARKVGLDAPFSRPVKLYLNGEYWGIYYLQERLDEHYLEDHYLVDPERCTMIKNWHSQPEFGDANDFKQLMRWLDTHDAKSQRNYDYLCKRIDIDNFIDYMVFETFIANWDWPANNTRFWQEKGGPWRWMFFDGDAALTRDDILVFENACYTGDDTWPSSTKASLLFRRCLENDRFRQQLRERMEVLTEGVLRYEETWPLLIEASKELRSEIPNHMSRFGSPESVEYWNWGLSLIDNFLKNRSSSFKSQFENLILTTEHELNPDRFVCLPNPTSGSFSLLLTDPYSEAKEVTIYDVYGRLVFSQPISAMPDEPIQIDVALRHGVYIVKLGNHCERLVCQ